MSATENRRLMEAAFDALALGDARPFRDLMADDIVWTVGGSTAWSGSYRGRDVVTGELLAPLFEQFDGRYTNVATRFVAEGDTVVVECRGSAATKRGGRYDNAYCYVCRLEGGRVRELTEYLDTQLVATALDPPPRARYGCEPPISPAGS